ncbi:MAG TPA: hypothetical protein DCE42_28155 [Myxococcales bacterium]|nr:hypothetical protein [Deltaproteobacteria bacterium]MBU53597.1 hypothetical protein [Deltaproteobacteria bacterium]HAA58668.1 hypothetical protein [Myxococcales bacterium]|tara:strand:+ start:7536 stop:8675 length:1140 start_codon:yes stop_codon:yes gene_type:complete
MPQRFEGRRLGAFLTVALGWLVVMVCSPLVWYGHIPWLSEGQIGWLFTLPLLLLSVGLFANGLWMYMRSSGPDAVHGYELAELMEELQRGGMIALHFIPFLGAVGIIQLLPGYMYTDVGIHHPFLVTLYAALLLIGLSRWLFRQPFWHAIIGVVVAFLCLYLGHVFHWSLPSLRAFVWHGLFVSLVFLMVFAYMGMGLRWWFRQTSFRASLQQGFYLTWLLVTLGGLLVVVWQGGVALNKELAIRLMLFGLLVLIWLGIRSIALFWQMTFLPRSFETLGGSGYVYAGTFPMALLVAWIGWVIFGGLPHQPTFQRDPMLLLSLFVIHLLAVSGFSALSSVHQDELRHQHRVWQFFRPVLVYLVVFLPFGFAGVAFFRAGI